MNNDSKLSYQVPRSSRFYTDLKSPPSQPCIPYVLDSPKARVDPGYSHLLREACELPQSL